MSLWDRVAHFMALDGFTATEPQLELREGTLEDLIARSTGQLRVSPWRTASIREALGVPAIYRAVSFIANTTGALSLEAFRNGVKLANEDRPRIIVRPNPFTIPRDFFRDTGWNMSTYGEAWWWTAARDQDNVALSLISVPPQEIMVTENPKDLRYPVIEWRGRRMANDDMHQLTLNRLPGDLRGSGPLQLCGAAASVAVEAQEWAANFYADGGIPSIWIKSAMPLSMDEATALKTQWSASPSNVPRVTDPGVEDIKQFEVNTESASMFEARDFNNAEAARMFGVAASLLDVPVGGQSLTYQNLEQEFTKFVRTCLWPNYLEPMEQTMSDFLTRSTVARFNVDAFLRPDTKTRFEVYKLGVEAGVMTAEQAAIEEGIQPGDVENAPMPLAMPQAVPASLPIQSRSQGPVRCPSCQKSRFVVESLDPPRLRCIRCKALVEETVQVRAEAPVAIPQSQPAPVINFHEGAFKAGDVHVESAPQPAPAVNFNAGAIQNDVHVPIGAEEVKEAAERIDRQAEWVAQQAERVDRTERAYLEALQAMRAEQPDFLAAMRGLAEEMKPKPARKRVIRDADNRIIGVEDE